jgi:hypothetical protein
MKYFRYGYVSDTYHGGKKIIHFKLSKVNAEKYYPYFNTMYSPEFAIQADMPIFEEIKAGNQNILNDLSNSLEDTPENFAPEDIDAQTEQKDKDMISNEIEQRKQDIKEVTGQLSVSPEVNKIKVEEAVAEQVKVIKMEMKDGKLVFA